MFSFLQARICFRALGSFDLKRALNYFTKVWLTCSNLNTRFWKIYTLSIDMEITFETSVLMFGNTGSFSRPMDFLKFEGNFGMKGNISRERDALKIEK